MAWLQSYNCTSAAGNTASDLFKGLLHGREYAQAWPQDPSLKAFLFHQRGVTSIRALLGHQLLTAFSPVRAHLDSQQPVGVILASTKGMSEDFVWQPAITAGAAAANTSDPLTPLLHDFLRRSELRPKRALCVSNACSSVLGGIALAEQWLEQGIPQVLILAADAVTPFVVNGFRALKLLSAQGVKPFAQNRSGFYLGDATACLLLTKSRGENAFWMRPVGLDSEGSAVTRPSHSGESLVRAALRIPDLREYPPDIIIAHGTGTRINDETEDLAFAHLFPAREPIVTGTKWCVGHTLAVSGALDIIAAVEALREQNIFSLDTTEEIDRGFKCRYLIKSTVVPQSFSRILISSLGFGGMHASLLVERPQ